MSTTLALGRRRPGFTLVELLVSMTVLLVIMSLIVGIVDQTSRIWRRTTAKITEFQDARSGFETIGRVLSQTTLNTYIDYVDDSRHTFLNSSNSSNSDGFVPSRYARQSQLHFVSGAVSSLVPTLKEAVTHAVFLQAPLGYTVDTTASGPQGLGSLLNACGFYLQFGPDTDRPDFVTPALSATRNRFRLFEFIQPTENLTVYNSNSGAAWFSDPGIISNVAVKAPPAADIPPTSRALSENIVALVILPQKSGKDDPTGAALCPDYSYDSRANATDAPQPAKANQLPPLVSVAMIAIDEPSALRLLASATDAEGAAKALGFASYQGLFSSASQLDGDLLKITAGLDTKRVNYRVFRTKVPIRAARWSDL